MVDGVGVLFGELQLGEKPPLETARIRNKRTDCIRPVLVPLRNKLLVAHIFREAGGLKKSESLNLFISAQTDHRNEHEKAV